METITNFSMVDIFIFDIDGCIMPDIFPNIKEIQIDNKIIEFEYKKKASNVSLYPEFIEFYKKNCTNSLAVYFLTGRKQKYYGRITQSQLKPLKIYKHYSIKHFPDNKPHISKEYFHWKAKTIKGIMNQWFHDSVRYHIYDDVEDIFPFIFREIPHVEGEYNCNLIQEQDDWVHIINLEL